MYEHNVPLVAAQAAIEIDWLSQGKQVDVPRLREVVTIVGEYVNLKVSEPFKHISSEARMVLRWACLSVIFKIPVSQVSGIRLKNSPRLSQRASHLLIEHKANLEQIILCKGNIKHGMRFCIALSEAASRYNREFQQIRRYTA